MDLRKYLAEAKAALHAEVNTLSQERGAIVAEIQRLEKRGMEIEQRLAQLAGKAEEHLHLEKHLNEEPKDQPTEVHGPSDGDTTTKANA